MKKKIGLILIILVVLGVVGIILFIPKKPQEKISLSSKYYNQEGIFLEKDRDTIKELKEDTYILYTFNSYCRFPIPCDSIFQEFMETNHINFVSIPYAEFKKTEFYPEVKYAPSIIIIQKNKVIAYLDADSDEDIDKYQDVEALTKWLEEYIVLTK